MIAPMPSKPRVALDLAGEDGNAFMIIARTVDALNAVDPSHRLATSYAMEAVRTDYDNLVAVTRRYVDIVDKEAY